MLILGIETSCDETTASLVEINRGKIKVLSNVVSSQVKLHAKYGGVVPSLAAREHVKNLPKVLKLTLNAKRCTLNAVDLIAVTRGPGLISSLLVGTTFAKTLAWKYKKPIVGVNHLEGHIASNWLAPVGEISNFQFPISKKTIRYMLNAKRSPVFPALCLIVSGGHTELVLMTSIGKYKIIGQTLDDAAGEAFDKIARILGLGYPGGPAISAIAERFTVISGQWSVNRKSTKSLNTNHYPLITNLPRPMLNSKNSDFSFAGLKTAVLYLVRNLEKEGHLLEDALLRAAVAAEAQQAIVDVLVSKTIKAAEKYKAKSIMLSGGVSANKLLRSNLNKTAERMNLKFFKPKMEYTTDNAAMIALAGYLKVEKANQKNNSLNWQNVKVDANLELM